MRAYIFHNGDQSGAFLIINHPGRPRERKLVGGNAQIEHFIEQAGKMKRKARSFAPITAVYLRKQFRKTLIHRRIRSRTRTKLDGIIIRDASFEKRMRDLQDTDPGMFGTVCGVDSPGIDDSEISGMKQELPFAHEKFHISCIQQKNF